MVRIKKNDIVCCCLIRVHAAHNGLTKDLCGKHIGFCRTRLIFMTKVPKSLDRGTLEDSALSGNVKVACICVNKNETQAQCCGDVLGFHSY